MYLKGGFSDWREFFSSPCAISLSPHISSHLEDEKPKHAARTGGLLSSKEPTTIDTRGGFTMHTQVKEAKMMRWAVIVGTLLFLTVFLVPTTQAAEEVAYRAVYHTVKSEVMEVGDVPGHLVGFSETPGLMFVTKGPDKGAIGTRKAWGYFDTVKGKGTITGYFVYTYPDGSTISSKATGTITPVDGGKRVAVEGTYDVTGGTGRFEGIKGKGTFKAERVGPRETGGDGYVDVTGTIWK
jgi:hypothetical protein